VAGVRNLQDIYDAICTVDARRDDPCLLDTIMSAVDQANGNPARPVVDIHPHPQAAARVSTIETYVKGHPELGWPLTV